MNYLAHLFLSPDDPELLLGSLIADFTRGRLETLARDWPPGVVRGIALHRQVDRFTDDHPRVIRARRRIAPPYRRYSGIILDILFDHYLCRYWSEFTRRDRDEFIRQVYRLLEQRREQLPARLHALVPRMRREDWLGSYRDLEVVGLVFERMSTRLRQPNKLAGALVEVRRHYPELAEDFRRFFPELIVFVQRQQEQMD